MCNLYSVTKGQQAIREFTPRYDRPNPSKANQTGGLLTVGQYLVLGEGRERHHASVLRPEPKRANEAKRDCGYW